MRSRDVWLNPVCRPGTEPGIDGTRSQEKSGVTITSHGDWIPPLSRFTSTWTKGQTDSAIAVNGPASGFTVTINNNAGGTIIGGGTANAAIFTGADNDVINNAGVINGKAIHMGAGNNALHITGGAASVIGDINGGVGGINAMTIDPGTGNQFSYAGAISDFNTVEISSGHVTLSGANTYAGKTVPAV